MTERIPRNAAAGLLDRAVGKAKQAAGAMLGRDDLRHEGALHEERAAAAAEARHLQTEADREAQRADLVEREQELTAQRQHLRVDAAADAAEQQIERRQLAEEMRANLDAARSEAQVERQTAVQETAADVSEVAAARDRVAAERQAQHEDARAETARRTADVLDPDREEHS